MYVFSFPALHFFNYLISIFFVRVTKGTLHLYQCWAASRNITRPPEILQQEPSKRHRGKYFKKKIREKKSVHIIFECSKTCFWRVIRSQAFCKVVSSWQRAKILNVPLKNMDQQQKNNPENPTAVCPAKPLLIWSPKGICRCIPPVWEQSLQSLECNAMKTNTTKPDNRGISHLHIFSDHLDLQRRGSPKHVSQQDLFVLGCCLFGQMSSQQWDRKTSSLILVSHGKRMGKKPVQWNKSHCVPSDIY